DDIVDKLMSEPEGTKMYLMAPVDIEVGEQYEKLWKSLADQGYVRVRIDGTTHAIDEVPTLTRRRKHDVDVVIDRIAINKQGRGRLAESVESALAVGKGVLRVAYAEEKTPEPRWRTKTHS